MRKIVILVAVGLCVGWLVSAMFSTGGESTTVEQVPAQHSAAVDMPPSHQQHKQHVQTVSTVKPAASSTQRFTKGAQALFVCPMHAHIQQHEAGECPICGMDLVESKPSIVSDEPLPAVKMSASVMHAMAVKSAFVRERQLPTDIETFGRVTYNEDTAVDFVPRANGWVETLYVKREGERVKKDQRLLEFYSPEILAAQDGYVLALKSNYTFSGERREFFDRVAREKLRLYGIPEKVVRDITETGELQQTISLLSPQAGVITTLDVDEGDAVKETERFMVIADMQSVWVNAEIYEHQLSQLQEDSEITVLHKAFPGETWVASIDYISAELNPRTNTLPVRLLVQTPKERLKPNMQVDIMFRNQPQQAVLTVPNEALIPLSNNQWRVVKITDKLTFQPVQVEPGRIGTHHTEILSGLEAGDKVVSSGQFLLDTESNLQASFSRM